MIKLIENIFQSIYPDLAAKDITLTPLKGDGSDRKWYRAACGSEFIIVVDHGPPANKGISEADAFAAIGRHLKKSGVPVPEIYAYDPPSGIVLLEDLGDIHLQGVIKNEHNRESITAHYHAVIDRLIIMQINGKEDFDTGNCLETPYYDVDVVLNRESRYFVEAFLNGYLELAVDFQDLEDEFLIIAKNALSDQITGFLHRDFQSRNILVKNKEYYFIDFQSGRLGPLQYDLASLLIDPYVELPEDLQQDLLRYYISRLSDRISLGPDVFSEVYQYNALNRNLQILGAFAYLGGVKGKDGFREYIPAAWKSLRARLEKVAAKSCPKLNKILKLGDKALS
jgi:aminoglycoside/choline kinase family phosphotransferase